jgi:hypothetical protein
MSAAPPWLDRATAELAELKERTRKLTAFLTSPAFKMVDDMSQIDLKRQLTAMEDYAYYLERRINRVS